jgi:hypothetical protein
MKPLKINWPGTVKLPFCWLGVMLYGYYPFDLYPETNILGIELLNL